METHLNNSQPVSPRPSLRGKTVLVTGGTGFIGGRLIEKLVLEEGARVRVLVRNFSRASRIARFPVEMIAGALDDPETVRRAVRGCAVVFHCAYANGGTPKEQWTVNVDGTRILGEAVAEEGVGRLVHVSSLAVYGRTPAGEIDETCPQQKWNNSYAITKKAAEEVLLRQHRERQLPVVILQPSIVYGPHSGWTVYPLEWLQAGRIVLVDGGDGLCNCVYVDDVVEALLLGATREGVLGQTFLISSDDPVPWRSFWGAYENMLETTSTIAISEGACRRRAWRQAMTPSLVSRARSVACHPKIQNAWWGLKVWRAPGLATIRARVKPLLSGNGAAGTPIHWPDPMQIDQAVMQTRLNLGKARERLGFRPQFDFEKGMHVTAEWARWARLLPEDDGVWQEIAEARSPTANAGLPDPAVGGGTIV